jgi:hypothetical protein
MKDMHPFFCVKYETYAHFIFLIMKQNVRIHPQTQTFKKIWKNTLLFAYKTKQCSSTKNQFI